MAPAELITPKEIMRLNFLRGKGDRERKKRKEAAAARPPPPPPAHLAAAVRVNELASAARLRPAALATQHATSSRFTTAEPAG
jgi:hypothetical protein